MGKKVPLISIDDVITEKEATGRDKDMRAVKELRAIVAKQAQKRDEGF